MVSISLLRSCEILMWCKLYIIRMLLNIAAGFTSAPQRHTATCTFTHVLAQSSHVAHHLQGLHIR